jgi:hypothetical protein
MFHNACILDGNLALFIPPDVVGADSGRDEVHVYGHRNLHRSNHRDFYNGAASVMFSPLSFTALGETMLYTSPNWWESSWAPTVVRDLFVLGRSGRIVTRLFLYRFALRFLTIINLMKLPRCTSCNRTGAVEISDCFY